MLRFFFLVVILCSPVLACEDDGSIKTVPLQKLRDIDPRISYEGVHQPIELNFKRFPLTSSEFSTWENPTLPKTFVLRLPKGRVFSDWGHVLVQERYLVEELLWCWGPYKDGAGSLNLKNARSLDYMPGTIVTLAQPGHRNYYHWMLEVLPKLSLLQGETYDWIYVPQELPFQKETLALMGVDLNKVLEAYPRTYIEADMVIAPSFVSRSCYTSESLACYTPRWVTDYLREHLMLKHQKEECPKFSDKIFISRQKASCRRISNEDEIFGCLEPRGFQRFNLEDLNVKDQISLFSNAQMIISSHGAGLANLIFCQPETKILEIFQSRGDATYFYLSQTLGLDYYCLKTTPFLKVGDHIDTPISLELFEVWIKKTMNEPIQEL